jgi:hypothetical protein
MVVVFSIVSTYNSSVGRFFNIDVNQAGNYQMKKTKRVSRTRSVRRVKPTERNGKKGLLWTLVVLIAAGAIGWYAYNKDGGTSGASAGTIAGQTITRVDVTSASSEPLRTGQAASFTAQAYNTKGQAVEDAVYSWRIDRPTTDSATGSIHSSNDTRYAQVSGIELPGNKADGYIAVIVQATAMGQPAVSGGKVLSVTTGRTLSQVSITPLISYIPLGTSRTISAIATDQSGKALADIAQYNWTLVNFTAQGDFGKDGNGNPKRLATGQTVTVNATTLGNSQAGGYFNILLKATYNGVSKYSGTIAWVPAVQSVKSVTVTAAPKSVSDGDQVMFQAVAKDQNGLTLKPVTKITWAPILVDGIVATKIAQDDVKMTATYKFKLPTTGDSAKGAAINTYAEVTYDGKMAHGSATIQVSPRVLAAVTLEPGTGTIMTGKPYRMLLTALDVNKKSISDAKYTWTTPGLASNIKVTIKKLTDPVSGNETGWADVTFTLDNGVPGGAAVVQGAAAYRGVSKSDTAVVTIHR